MGLELRARGCWWVLKRNEFTRLVQWWEFDDVDLANGWEIVDWFRTRDYDTAKDRARAHGTPVPSHEAASSP